MRISRSLKCCLSDKARQERERERTAEKKEEVEERRV